MPAILDRRRKQTPHPDTRSYRQRIAVEGGTISSQQLQGVDRLVRSLERDGFKQSITEFYPLLGELNGCKVKLYFAANSTLTLNNFAATDYTYQGLKGNASNKYADTNFAANNLSASNNHILVGGFEMETTSFFTPIGAYNNPPYYDFYSASPGNMRFRNADANTTTQVTANATDLYSSTLQSGDTSFTLTSVTDSVSISTSGSSLPSVNVYIFAVNANGSMSNPSAFRCRVASMGAGLSVARMSAYRLRITNYLQSIGR